MKGRPYRVEDFRDALRQEGLFGDVIALGAYQMNHIWAVTFASAEATKKMVGVAEMTVKGRRCLVIDPGNRDLRIKLHWILHNVPDEEVKVAFAPFGRVTEVTKEKWRVDGCSKQSTMTRVAVLKLNVGVKPDDIPHQLRIAGDLALVVVPGRPPKCLRCQREGHVRRECRVPRCNTCRRFGHESADCVKTYAAVARNVAKEDSSEMIMDEEDSEEAAGAKGKSVEAESTVEPPPEKGVEGGNPGRVESPSRLDQSPGEGTSIKEGATEAGVTVSTATPTSEGATSDEEMANAAGGVRKRSSSESHSQSENLEGPPPKATSLRRATFKPKPKVRRERVPMSAKT